MCLKYNLKKKPTATHSEYTATQCNIAAAAATTTEIIIIQLV